MTEYGMWFGVRYRSRNLAMTSMNISLPESMKAFVEEQVAAGGYGITSAASPATKTR